jgi:TraB/PrgY/gumN family
MSKLIFLELRKLGYWACSIAFAKSNLVRVGLVESFWLHSFCPFVFLSFVFATSAQSQQTDPSFEVAAFAKFQFPVWKAVQGTNEIYLIGEVHNVAPPPHSISNAFERLIKNSYAFVEFQTLKTPTTFPELWTTYGTPAGNAISPENEVALKKLLEKSSSAYRLSYSELVSLPLIHMVGQIREMVLAKFGRTEKLMSVISSPGVSKLIMNIKRSETLNLDDLENRISLSKRCSDTNSVNSLIDSALFRSLDVSLASRYLSQLPNLLEAGNPSETRVFYQDEIKADPLISLAAYCFSDERNRMWAAKLDVAAKAGRVVAVFGIHHALAGSNTLIYELTNRGYTIKPLN